MTRAIVVYPDAQVPYHHPAAARAINNFVRAFQPDEIASVGDEVDFPQISRWTRGLEGEYRGDLQKHVDAGVAYLEGIRAAFPTGPFHITRSNHMDRPLKYVAQHAPGLMGLRALTVESLLEFEELGITYHRRPYELAPEWLLVHGDEGGMSQEPGRTALRLANKFGKSVVCGHTHRLGLISNVQAVNGKTTRALWGFEVGNIMDMRKAGYLGGGSANWHMGAGILYVDGRHVTPVLVPLRADGSFTVGGREYRG
jgi:hypothetical protein